MPKDSLDENLFPRDVRRFDLFDLEEHEAGAVTAWVRTEEGVDLELQGGALRVAPYADRILRMVLSSVSGADGVSDPGSVPEGASALETPPSYFVVSEDRAAEGKASGDAVNAEGGSLPAGRAPAQGPRISGAAPQPSEALPPAVAANEEGGEIVINAGALRVRIDLESGRIALSRGGGDATPLVELLRSVPGRAFRWSPRGTALDLELPEGRPVYGLGEKTGYLDRRGRSYRMWNSDEPTHLPNRDPLYQSIPFLLMPAGAEGAHASGGAEDGWLGLLLDTPGSAWFDVGETDPGRLTAAVEERRLQVYLIVGATPEEVLMEYADLTGHAPLPPLWAIGYHQSRHSYTPAERVREIAHTLRSRRLPADVIHLDIEYMDGYRVFTWDPAAFRDPAALMQDLAAQSFHVVTIVDPGVKVDPDYAVYRSGSRIDAFCRKETGDLYVGRVWPGAATFPDFSKPEVRAWWADNHRGLFDMGVSGIWNDMNEPADFTGDFIRRPEFTPPSTVIMDGDGYPRSMDAYHNVYGMLMSRAARAASEQARPGKRPFILTRAGAAGIQRYAAVWTGDNHSWWEHLQASIPMLLGMGLSGVGFAGSDIGGFQDNPSPELYARWIQYAALTPFMRTHTSSATKDQEPWSFGPEVEEISRRYLELRYRLLPYLYTLFYQHSVTGAPIMRPLMWHYPDDPMVRNENTEFLLGDALLAAPVSQPGVRARAVYLPAGRWMDFWTGERFDGGGHVLADAPPARMPLYVKLPSLIPMIPVVQSTAEFHEQPLELRLFGADEGRACRSSYYEDDADSLAYADGAFSLYTITWEPDGVTGGNLRIHPERSGFTGSRPRWELLLADGGDDAESVAPIDLGLPAADEARVHRIDVPTS